MVKKQDEIDGGVKDEPEKETPEAELETTPDTEEVVTLSKKEIEDQKNAAKADLGRALKLSLTENATLKSQFDEQLKRYSELESTLSTFKQRDREAELERFKDDKGMYDATRMRHQIEDEREQVKRQRSDFEKEKAQHQARIEAAMKAEAESLAKELAQKSGLEATLILQIGTDTADGQTSYNLERMKQIAKSVPKGEKDEDEDEGESPRVRGQRSRAAGAGSRTATKGISNLTDAYEAFNKGEITIEEMAKFRQRFEVS